MRKNLYLLLCMVFVVGCPLPVFAQIITTIAGGGSTGFTGDGSAAVSATFNAPTCLATDASGNLYINDQGNNCVRKVDPSGIITTIAGNGTPGFMGDNGPATAAELSSNWGMAVDAAGNVYITDQNNNRVRKVSTSGVITTIAGTGTPGFWGDGGAATAALLHTPIGIAVDGAGNIYIGDASNWRIRMINTSGIISTIAGSGAPGFAGDGGPALMANLGNTFGLAVDGFGNVYFCDVDAPYSRVRKIDGSGNISTVAGTAVSGYNGDTILAVTAELNVPTGVFADNAGGLYISDYNNNRIRKVNASGIIYTYAGTGVPGFFGDGNLAIDAKLDNPIYVTMNSSNTVLYLTDFNNVRIREVSNANVVYFTGGKTQYLTVCENTTADPINSLLAILDHEVGLTDTWSILSGPFHGSASVSYSTTATGSTFTPVGLSYTPSGGYAGNDTLTAIVSDGLAADTTTIYITVDPVLPFPGSITGASNVCVGSSITLSETVTGGIWSGGNTDASVVGSVVTGISEGSVVVTYAVSNPCGTTTISKIISVNALPDPGIITGVSEMCIGSSISLTDTITGGIWNTSNNLATVSPTATGSKVTGLAKGVDTVLYTATNTLCEATIAFGVTIDTFPSAGAITGLPGVCVGSQITMSDATGSGRWSVSNGNASLAGDTLTGVSSGRDSVIYNVTNTCGTDSTIQVVIVEPLPDTPAIAEIESVLSVPAGYTSYEWTLNGAKIPGATVDTYLVAVTGIYDVIVTNTFGCSVAAPPIQVYGCDPDNINIYPNPASSLLYIDWCKKVTIRIFGMDGKPMTLNENTNEINIEILPNGVYMISLFDANGIRIKTKRITKISK